jgi:hypothetical protein
MPTPGWARLSIGVLISGVQPVDQIQGVGNEGAFGRRGKGANPWADRVL